MDTSSEGKKPEVTKDPWVTTGAPGTATMCTTNGPRGRSLGNANGQDKEGRNVSPRGYPATTAFSSLNPGIGGIDSVIAVAGVHKVKPCSEGTSSHEER